MRIDLNADLGESDAQAGLIFPDEQMLAIVTSANVACGHHAGDRDSMLATTRRAAELGVVVGAHVSYLDRDDFGRRRMDVDAPILHGWVVEQLDLMAEVCRRTGAVLGYVKPHGALYNRIAADDEQAQVVVEAVAEAGGGIGLLGLPGSAVESRCRRAGLPFHIEAFADRGYAADGSLVPRGEPGALLHDPDEVAARIVGLVTRGELAAVDGTVLRVNPDSVCVHGDSPGAVEMAAAVRAALTAAGVHLSAFAGS
ncbi:5-oxoprolinase subunit PxpA [Aestuariimicrobium ganziense]|uniref:5-oxoprolinase subunit PxpA n=1 Tax=Aestuariimicrobium ganziense TaxID=2773677 RepID=UPI0019449043|nr:5-oxoprolinase subunit PxpA [Aestuariimicrobium ganziense]